MSRQKLNTLMAILAVLAFILWCAYKYRVGGLIKSNAEQTEIINGLQQELAGCK